ncbi:MAG: hypothetical protein WCF90_04780 [Methanomicrobiales archaeon]
MMAILSAESVITNEVLVSDALGNAARINGRAGATAALSIRIVMAESIRKRNVHFDGLNGNGIKAHHIANDRILRK